MIIWICIRETFSNGGFFLKLDSSLMNNIVDKYNKASEMSKSNLIQFQKPRENYQIRQKLIDNDDINFGKMKQSLHKIATNILFNTLDALHISKDDQNKLFSGFDTKYFDSNFCMNLYLDADEGDGVYLHKDFTYITILYPDYKVPGLADANGNIITVPESCLLVFYGETLELLTDHKINALSHQVKKVEEDRLTMALFLTGPYKDEPSNNDLLNVPFLVTKHCDKGFGIIQHNEYSLYKNFHENRLKKYYGDMKL